MSDYVFCFNSVTRCLSKLCVKFPMLKMEIYRDDSKKEFTIKIFFKGGGGA
jgi:hypothetical protein